jgi:hypothetical protein
MCSCCLQVLRHCSNLAKLSLAACQLTAIGDELQDLVGLRYGNMMILSSYVQLLFTRAHGDHAFLSYQMLPSACSRRSAVNFACHLACHVCNTCAKILS